MDKKKNDDLSGIVPLKSKAGTDIIDSKTGILLAKAGTEIGDIGRSVLNDRSRHLKRVTGDNILVNQLKEKSSDLVLSEKTFYGMLINTKLEFRAINRDIISGNESNLEKRLFGVVDRVYKLLKENINPYLGVLYMGTHNELSVSRPLYRAGISYILGYNDMLCEEEIKFAIASGLAVDFGLLPIVKDIENSIFLPEEYKKIIKNRRILAAEVLKRGGINEKEIIFAYLDSESVHYKRLEVANIFTALMWPKDYVINKTKKMMGAVPELYTMAKNGELEFKYVKSLIKGNEHNIQSYYFGKYPPGTIIKLNSGKTAVVTRSATFNQNDGNWISCPTVRTFLNSSGLFLLEHEKSIRNPLEIRYIEDPKKYSLHFQAREPHELWGIKNTDVLREFKRNTNE